MIAVESLHKSVGDRAVLPTVSKEWRNGAELHPSAVPLMIPQALVEVWLVQPIGLDAQTRLFSEVLRSLDTRMRPKNDA